MSKASDHQDRGRRKGQTCGRGGGEMTVSNIVGEDGMSGKGDMGMMILRLMVAVSVKVGKESEMMLE